MLKRVAIGLIVLAVIGSGVLFVLDRTIFAPAEISTDLPVAPTLAAPTAPPTSIAVQPTESIAAKPTESAATAGAPPSSGNTPAAQLYRIDAAQSEVRYEVNETFLQGNRLNTAVGRTSGVAGDILVNFAEPAKSQVGDIVINISQFKSDESRRDNFIHNNGLESARYPEAMFKTQTMDGLPAQVAAGDEIKFTLQGDLTVKETTRPVTWDVTLTVEDGRLVGTATTQILMSDFGVGPIKLAILETEDLVKLFFDFTATPVES